MLHLHKYFVCRLKSENDVRAEEQMAQATAWSQWEAAPYWASHWTPGLGLTSWPGPAWACDSGQVLSLYFFSFLLYKKNERLCPPNGLCACLIRYILWKLGAQHLRRCSVIGVWSFFSFLQVFIDFVIVLLLFCVLGFWLSGMWDLSFRTRDWTHIPCIGMRSLNHWIARKVSLVFFWPPFFYICLFLSKRWY